MPLDVCITERKKLVYKTSWYESSSAYTFIDKHLVSHVTYILFQEEEKKFDEKLNFPTADDRIYHE